MHESNDMTDTAQLTIFIHVIHSKYEYYVHEDAASLCGKDGTTAGEDLFVSVK